MIKTVKSTAMWLHLLACIITAVVLTSDTRMAAVLIGVCMCAALCWFTYIIVATIASVVGKYGMIGGIKKEDMIDIARSIMGSKSVEISTKIMFRVVVITACVYMISFAPDLKVLGWSLATLEALSLGLRFAFTKTGKLRFVL